MTVKTVVLFDDERSFKPGVCDDAIVVRTVDAAVELFKGFKESGTVIDELWFDFVLSPGSTYEAVYALAGVEVREAFYHSSASSGRELLEAFLANAGHELELELRDRSVFVDEK